MNLETRKINLINWISTLQEESILSKMEEIQGKSSDWWDGLTTQDKEAINKGINQLDDGDFLDRSQVRNKIKARFNF